MVLKANVTYGAKRSHDYNSDSFQVTLEAEVSNPNDAQGEIENLFTEAQNAVNLAIQRNGTATTKGKTRPNTGNGKASDKQIAYVRKLALLARMTDEELLKLADTPDITSISSEQASTLIDQLKTKKQPNRRKSHVSSYSSRT